jgi:uncharacterized integral membrane protein
MYSSLVTTFLLVLVIIITAMKNTITLDFKF